MKILSVFRLIYVHKVVYPPPPLDSYVCREVCFFRQLSQTL